MLFFFACLYVALYYIRPFEWVPGLIGLPVFYVFSLVCVVALLGAAVSGQIKLFKYKTDLLVVGFTLAIVLSHLRHGYIAGVIEGVRHFFPILVGYFLIAHALDTKKKINIFLLLLIGLTTFLAYESYLQITTGIAHGGLEPLLQKNGYSEGGVRLYTTRTRWYGVFNDPNDLGLALVLVVPLLLERCFLKRWLLPILTLPSILYAVYCTNSRGAIVSLAAGVFSYLVLRYRSLRGVIMGCVLAFLGITFGPSRMAEMSGSEQSAYGRIYAWYEGFQMFKSYPVFGVGSGNFTQYNSLTAHNSYMLVLAELGFFGSLFFVGLFVLPLLWAKSQLLVGATGNPTEEQERTQACALIGCLVGLMAAMFFLSRSYILLPYMVVAVIVAFANQVTNEKQNVKNNPFVKRLSWKLLFGVVVFEIIFINVFVKVFI